MMLSELTLGEICDQGGGIIRTGPFGSQLHESDYSEIGAPVVMPKDIIEGKVAESTIARVGQAHIDRLEQHRLRPGDIVYGRRGDIGRQALITERESGWLCGTGCLRITPGNSVVDSKWLHYYLRDSQVIAFIAQQAVGATMPNLNTSILRSIPIRFPDLPTQRRIASILSAYDDLIENNTRRIAILEEMARRIYEEWFVRFRFPGHDQMKRVESELGLIPEGWAFKVKDALESSLGGDWGSDSPAGDDTEPVAVIRGTDFEDCQRGRESRCPLRYITKSSLTKRALRVGDIVIENSINAKSRTSGKPLFITTGLLKRLGGPVIAASFCKVFRLRSPELAPLLYLKMKRQFEEGEMAFFQNIAANGIANFQAGRYIENEAFWIPQELLGQRLVDTLTIILKGAANYADKNANLRATRDLLLPKLISGELDVSTQPEPEEAIAA